MIPPSPTWLASTRIQREIGFRIARPLNPPPIKSHGKYWDADVDDLKKAVTEYLATSHSFTGIVDPKLPAGEVDLILCVDVYHEFSHPEHMLAAMRKALAPGGQVVLVEFRAEDPKVPIKPLHKMSKKQILKELPPNGFKLAREFDELPWQHMMFFERRG